MKRRLAIVTLGASLFFGASVCAAADLTVIITGIDSADGEINVGLLDGPEGFPQSRERLAGQQMKASTDGARVTFSGLKPGRYAIAAFHDKNGNAALDTNLFGIPTEPYGFSNNARGNFGPPSFEDAAVILEDDVLEIQMRLSE